MDFSSFLTGLVTGIAIGVIIAFLLKIMRIKTAKEFAGELLKEGEIQRQAALDSVIENIKANFGNLSLEALSKSSQEFLKLAKTSFDSAKDMSAKELESKKGLIDQQLVRMTSELEKVSKTMQDLEKDRVEKFGELSNHLKNASEQTQTLTRTTNTLKEALASTKARGQWGERMAEDVLRFAGFVENVNYRKQKSIDSSGSRPDFTFLLPNDLMLNMDVKFPLDNYSKYLDASSETDKAQYKIDFLKNVKSRIKEITTRDYINPEQNTIDSVLLFIPNEQIYAFIHEQDSTIIDEGLKNKVVLCSPITLFAVLAVIRQAVDNFSLSQTSNEILSLLGTFKKQWDMFLKKLELFGKRIGDTQKEYDDLMSTRRRQLEKPLNKIEDLRTQRGLAASSDEDDALSPIEKNNSSPEKNI